METQSPYFESIKQISPYQADYWSARDLTPLLGYNKWQNFEVAIKRAMTSCEQIGQNVTDHFTGVSKMLRLGSDTEREVKDYLLSQFACYLIAQNGDPRKKEIAEAQAYFAISTWKQELAQLLENQEERIKLRERVTENNKALAQASSQAGVLSQNFGVFQNAGYKGLYGELGMADIKERKKINQREDLLDRMGRAELAANDFRITQTEERLRRDGTIGQTDAMGVHHEVGKKVRNAIQDIGGTMPENLAPEPSIKPIFCVQNRKRKKLPSKSNHNNAITDVSPQDTLWE
jgi:DNA-damage-inducible protein D